jgi:hypothetical protein
MGTLFNQPSRQLHNVDEKSIVETIIKFKNIAEKYNVTFDQVIKIADIKEAERTNDLHVYSGDVHDEQMAGFGELIQQLDATLFKLTHEIKNHSEN